MPPRVALLDGGTGEELFARGLPDDRKLWSATALVHEQHHALLLEVHDAFLHAGADWITCNNYGVTPGVGFSDADMARHTAMAGRLARQACDRFVEAQAEAGRAAHTQVCGSLPPLLESYRADRVPEHGRGVELYALIARTLRPFVDGYVAETLSSVQEAKLALLGVQRAQEHDEEEHGKSAVLVSFTLNSHGQLRSGERVCDAVLELLHLTRADSGESTPELRAVLFNCSQPEAISKALLELQANEEACAGLRGRGVRLGAYANKLTAIPDDWALAESREPQAMRTDVDVQRYAAFVDEWVALGAEIVGGCCGVGPEYIAKVHSMLQTQGRR